MVRLADALEWKGDMVEHLFGFRPKITYGKSSKELLEGMKLYRTGKGGKSIGARFEGKKVFVWDAPTGKSILSRDAKSKAKVDKITKLIAKAKVEYEASLEADLRKTVEATDEAVEEIRSNTEDTLAGRILDIREDLEQESITLNIPASDLREVMGALDLAILRQGGQTATERMEVLDIDITHWEKKAEDEGDPLRKRFYESVVRVERLTKDYISVRNGLNPESDEALGIVEEEITGSDELRLSRFARWAKENMVGISAIAISVAGLITGIIMAARGALKVGVKGLGKFAGAVARVFKKLGPVFAALGFLVSTVLSWGAKGILWMANNLRFLVIVVLAALYSEYGRRRALKQ